MSEAREDTLPDTQSGIDSELDIYRHPLVQSLLDALPQPLSKTPWTLTFPICKQMEEENKIIIAGYASVEVIDSQNELIPLPVLKEAWDKFKANKYFATGSLMHSNIPIIRILDSYTDSKGQVWKSGVDDTGLFVVAEVRNDIEKGKQTIQLIKDGKLTGFSIGGEALESSIVCEGRTYTRIDKMELHEIAVVDKPANQPSIFTIIKSERIHKLEELTALLPNLIISPGVVKIAGSIAELGKGHDFDLLISASQGSFVDRAAQTRIYNELRKIGREDLWKDLHIIHEAEGLGPFTDHLDLYDLVLLRADRGKMKMVKRKIQPQGSDGKVDNHLQNSVAKLDKAIDLLIKGNGPTPGIPYDTITITAIPGQVVAVEREEVVTGPNEEFIQAEAIIGESVKRLDMAISRLRLKGKMI